VLGRSDGSDNDIRAALLADINLLARRDPQWLVSCRDANLPVHVKPSYCITDSSAAAISTAITGLAAMSLGPLAYG